MRKRSENFGGANDSTEYIHWSDSKSVRLSDLKPSETTISIRMPKFLIADLKFLGNQQGVPYQSLLKIFVAEKTKEELSLKSKKTLKSQKK